MESSLTRLKLLREEQYLWCKMFEKGGKNENGRVVSIKVDGYTVELQWLEHLWAHENLFETGVVRANEG